MKSHNMSYLGLVTNVYKDAVAMCAAESGTVRDLETLGSRIEHEGLSFLTITLPDFGDAFFEALQSGKIDLCRFRSFKKRGQIPAFLQGIVCQVFDVNTGGLFDEPSIAAISAIRQICYCLKKLNIACTHVRVQKTLSAFREIESDFDGFESDPDCNDSFDIIAYLLWCKAFREYNPLDATPKHGPGSTAERIRGNSKYNWQFWTQRLEDYFPFIGFGQSSYDYNSTVEYLGVEFLGMDEERPVRVVTVPKTLKSPRTIALEPCCMQYAQQAVASDVIRILEEDPNTSGHINFSDQRINQQLAVSSSRTGELVTIDLSSASDRVPLVMVERMLKTVPNLLEPVLACRSRIAEMPDGEIIHLRKFASMGSALCFPIEAMYYYTICVLALIVNRNLPFTAASVKSVSRQVYVYGDDIIVPVGDAAAVIDHLQKYNCKVNTAKTFVTGKFRESCGVDCYDGELVTPVYIRSVPPSHRRDAPALISYVATANQFHKAGYWRTSQYIFECVERFLGKLPYVGPNAAALGRVTFLGRLTTERMSAELHRPEVKAWVPCPVYIDDEIDGYSALTKSLIRLEYHQDLSSSSITDLIEKETGELVVPARKGHLECIARYGTVTLKRRWVTPY